MSSTSTYDGFYSTDYQYVAQAYSITAVVLGIILGLMGKFYMMFNLIDALAIIFFLFCMKINAPANVVDFSKMFGNYHYDKMYDYLKSSVSNSYTYTANPGFSNFGLNAFFLDNTTLSFCIIIGMIGVYVLLKLASFIPMGRLQVFLKESLRRAWEFDYFIYILWIFYNQFLVFSFLQKDAMDFDSTLKIVNFVIFAIIVAILISSPFLFCYLIQSNKGELALPENQRSSQIRFLSLVSGYKINIDEEDDYNNPNINRNNEPQNQNSDRKEAALSIKTAEGNQDTQVFLNPEDQKQYTPLGKYTTSMVMIRKIIFAGILVFIQEQKLLQVIVFSGFNIILILLYSLSRPHLLLINNIRDAITEASFIGLQISIYFFDSYSSTTSSSSTSTTTTTFTSNNTDSVQIKLGWFYISLCVLVLVGHLLDVLVKTIIEIVKLVRTNNSNKVVPIALIADNQLDDLLKQQPQQQQQQPQIEQQQKAQNIANQQPQMDKNNIALSNQQKEIQKQQQQINQNNQQLQQQQQQMQQQQKLLNQQTQQQIKSQKNLELAQQNQNKNGALLTPDKQNIPQTLQFIPLINNENQQNINNQTYLDNNIGEQIPPKTAKTSFNEFMHSDMNILPDMNPEEKQIYKKRIRTVLFKRNPYIPSEGYYDSILHNSERKNVQSKTTLGLGSGNNFNNLMMPPTNADIQNF